MSLFYKIKDHPVTTTLYILGAIASIISLVYVLQPSNSPVTEYHNSSGKSENNPRQAVPAPASADNSLPPSCRYNTHLIESINTAKSIYDSNKRDNVYVSLVYDALCAEQYDVALDTASKIHDGTIRDDCRFRSVEFLIHKDNMDYANRFAENIYDTTVRDKAKRVIIEEVRSLPSIPKSGIFAK